MSEIVENVYGEDEVLCEIIKEGDDYFLVDLESNEATKIEKTSDGDYFALPVNRANRKWAAVKKVDATLEKGERVTMTYKATRKFGPIGNKIPHEKLISYLSEEDQAEYRAIIARAQEAKAADKAQPKTELEKAKEKLARAQAALDKLMQEAAE